MTLASTNTKVTYNGDDSTTVFAVTFVFFQNSDLRVILRDALGAETVWVEGTQYTLAGGAGSTGTLTVKTTPTDYTPATGEKLLIKSAISETQGSALPLGGAFPSTTVEQMVDIVTRLVQQHSEEIARGFTAAETDDNPGSMPTSTERASKFLAFDAGGNAIASPGSVDTVTVSAFMATVVDDADAATARTTLGLGDLAIENRSDIQGQTFTAFNDTGAADAYVITPVPAITAYAKYQAWQVDIANANTGASTMNINGLGVRNIFNYRTGAALTGGELAAGLHVFIDDGTQLILMNPVTAGVDIQTFTASGTWNKPAGATRILVQAWGAGGSGAKGATSHGGGGGGGAYTETWIDASAAGATETVTIGAGGAAISVANTDGNAGTNTTFGSLATGYAGGGGGTATSGGGGGGGGIGGIGASATGDAGANGGVGPAGGGGAVDTAGEDSSTGGGGGGGGRSAGSPGRGGHSGHGGGGGGGALSSSGTVGGAGGDSGYGGGGGGGAGVSGGAGGTSALGGNGGTMSSAGTAGSGVVPGGGGGGTRTGTSGAGADGQMIVTTWS